MNLTLNDLKIVIADLYLEIYGLRIQCEAQATRLKELEPPAAPPILKEVTKEN